ncbi:hypothetical protein MBELCI_0198 [Limimaricola cinnabarinus LL-001]|uniref:Uncharacterized protein n=1 Tax=Limimaricola cinnabarinus LL-001 TaxID=1337093 RepID=U2YHT5_9RHOB|nr:hypothetical protein MBELCI_0198 [Limimaricola cinnabarinus LL-001]
MIIGDDMARLVPHEPRAGAERRLARAAGEGSTIRVDVVIATTLSRAARNTAMVRASADAASAETDRVPAGGAAGGVEVWRPAMKATMSIRARITPTRLARMIPPGFGVVAARTRARSIRKPAL